MNRSWQGLLPYLAALLVAALVLGLRRYVLGNALPGILWVAPVVVAAWWGGLKPGLFATGLTVAIGLFFIVLRGNVLDGNFNPVPLVSMIAIGVAVSWLFESLHASHRRIKEREQQLRASEERLVEADRRKDQFLATLAHELRNPLAPLSNALQLWPLVENDRYEMENLRELMHRQVQQMVRLIDDLLDVSRITRGKVELRKQPVNLKTVIETAVEATRPLIEACGHHLTVVVPEEPLVIEADVARLVQVIGNLLNNAAKYTEHGGHIWLTAEQDQQQAVIRVRDTGPGIPEAMLSQVFDIFVQVDSTLHRSHGGLGVGLTLCKTLVEMHGGTIEARSEGLGKGSEFLVRLPLAKPETITALVDKKLSVRRIDSLPVHRILVVDDVVASATTLAMMLKGLGQTVEALHDGPSALETAQTLKPDVAFLDIGMPGMDGYQLARALRDNADLKAIVLVALTGYGQEEDRRQAFEAGFDHHMVKPTSMDALQELLLTVPARHASRSMLESSGQAT